jgi:hypothetical protein
MKRCVFDAGVIAEIELVCANGCVFVAGDSGSFRLIPVDARIERGYKSRGERGFGRIGTVKVWTGLTSS